MLKILKSFISKSGKPQDIIAIISLVITAAVIGFLIPQVGDTGPAYFNAWQIRSPLIYSLVDTLQLNRIYSSYWFLVLIVLTLVLLARSIWHQFKRARQPLNFASLQSKPPIHHLSNFKAKDLSTIMSRNGYSLKQTEDNLYLFSKHDFAKWGSTLFHVGILLLIIAGIWRLGFQQRGFVTVIEGDIFDGQYEEFVTNELGLFLKRFDIGFKIFLNEFSHDYWDTDKIKEISSQIVFLDSNNRKLSEARVSVNHPVKHKGVTIHQTFDHGYTISFKLKKTDGKSYQSNFILKQQTSKQDPARGISKFPLTPYIFTMDFHPDISQNSFLPGKPILQLSISHSDGREVFNGLVLPGDTIKVENNLLYFNRISYWSGLVFERSSEITWAYLGLVIICIGAGIMFFFTPKKIILLIRGQELLVYGWSKRFKAIFNEELTDLKKILETSC